MFDVDFVFCMTHTLEDYTCMRTKSIKYVFGDSLKTEQLIGNLYNMSENAVNLCIRTYTFLISYPNTWLRYSPRSFS